MGRVRLVFLMFGLAITHTSFSQSINARYRFDGNINDITGNSHHGSYFGATPISTFLSIPDDINTHATIPGDVVRGLGDIAVSFNVRFNVLHYTGNFPTNAILQGTRSNQMNPFAIAYEAANSRFRIVFEATNYDFPFVANASQWYCILIVRKSSMLNVYVDGVALSTGVNVISNPVMVDTLILGQEQDCVGGCFAQDQSLAGDLDNLQIATEADPDLISCSIPPSNIPALPVSGGGSYCSGTTVSLNASPLTGTTVYWYSDSLRTSLLDSGNTYLPLSNVNATYYAIQVLNGQESAVSSVTVHFKPVPEAIGTSSVQNGVPPLTVDFNDLSSNATSIIWHFGNGESSRLNNPSTTYLDAGSFEVLLIAYNAGCSDTAVLSIDVSSDSHLIVPNVFTPNYDNSNDLFLIDHLNIVDYEIRIFDRWGILLFDSDKPNEPWDGTTGAGTFVPTGTYFYSIKAKGLDNKSYDLTGFVLLSRQY